MKTTITSFYILLFLITLSQAQSSSSVPEVNRAKSFASKKDSLTKPNLHNLTLDTSANANAAQVVFETFWKAIFTGNMTLFSQSTGVEKGHKSYQRYAAILPDFAKKIKTMQAPKPLVLGIYQRNNVYLVVAKQNLGSMSIAEHFVYKVNGKFYATDENLRRNAMLNVKTNRADTQWLLQYWRKFKLEIIKELEQVEPAS